MVIIKQLTLNNTIDEFRESFNLLLNNIEELSNKILDFSNTITTNYMVIKNNLIADTGDIENLFVSESLITKTLTTENITNKTDIITDKISTKYLSVDNNNVVISNLLNNDLSNIDVPANSKPIKNLNADLLDNREGSYYTEATNIKNLSKVINLKWEGSVKYVSEVEPKITDGNNGDFWFIIE